MPLEVRPATRLDIPAMADIFERAFATDPVFSHMYPGTTPAQLQTLHTRMFEDGWELPGRKCFVVVDTDTQDKCVSPSQEKLIFMGVYKIRG